MEPQRKSRKVSCSQCNMSLAYRHLAIHLETCVGAGKFCAVCETMLVNKTEREVREHLLTCGRKTYPCNECGTCFSTGRARNIHNCRRPTPSRKRRIIDPPGTQSAVHGLFKMIEVEPSSSFKWDWEDVLLTEKPRIMDILG